MDEFKRLWPELVLRNTLVKRRSQTQTPNHVAYVIHGNARPDDAQPNQTFSQAL